MYWAGHHQPPHKREARDKGAPLCSVCVRKTVLGRSIGDGHFSSDFVLCLRKTADGGGIALAMHG